MARKSAVTQQAVNAACEQLHTDGKPVTVNGVIGLTGGSFSTIGTMVKTWREEQDVHTTTLPDIPEKVKNAMHKATGELWVAASTLAAERVETVEKDAREASEKFRVELSEYAGEITRLERELEQAQQSTAKSKALLSEARTEMADLQTKNAALEARLSDRIHELERLQVAYDKLQEELLNIAREYGNRKNGARNESKGKPSKP